MANPKTRKGGRSGRQIKRINLALQGGGAHGAYTWGVLDRLLQDPAIEIAAISGTSAGALNGAAVKAGLTIGGPREARANLDWLWGEIGAIRDPDLSALLHFWAPAPDVVSRALEFSPAYAMLDTASRIMSPYSYGPFYQNPLRRIAEKLQYDAVCSDTGPEFCICATNVRSGKIKVFNAAEIGPAEIMASACIPTMFQAVEIDGEAYWDGGYLGNPALFPLFQPQLPNDIVIVNINPLERQELPKTPQEIQNRINEISFNSSLLRELRAINFVKRLIRDGIVENKKMKDVYVHMIADDDMMQRLSVATKLLPTPSVLADLKAAGQAAADQFLTNHHDDLNVKSTIDLEAMFV